jgi:hypothetical protein
MEEFIAKVNRTMTPRGKKFPTSSTTPDQQSPLRPRYAPGAETTPTRPLQITPPSDYMMSPTSLQRPQPPTYPPETPERATQRQFMPTSSPAPFFRYSTITTPATVQDRSSPPSSGQIDLAETLVEFSSPVKSREPFVRRISTPEQESPPPVRNGIKSSLGDLQGVDLLRGFEKISSLPEWGSSPVKEHRESSDLKMREEDNAFGKEFTVMEKEHERVNGNNVGQDCPENGTEEDDLPMDDARGEEMDSQMTEIKMEEAKQ